MLPPSSSIPRAWLWLAAAALGAGIAWMKPLADDARQVAAAPALPPRASNEPPLAPPQQQPAPVAAAPVAKPLRASAFVLAGTSSVGSDRVAVITDPATGRSWNVRRGDPLGAFVVKAIEADEALLEAADHLERVAWSAAPAPRPAPRPVDAAAQQAAAVNVLTANLPPPPPQPDGPYDDENAGHHGR